MAKYSLSIAHTQFSIKQCHAILSQAIWKRNARELNFFAVKSVTAKKF